MRGVRLLMKLVAWHMHAISDSWQPLEPMVESAGDCYGWAELPVSPCVCLSLDRQGSVEQKNKGKEVGL